MNEIIITDFGASCSLDDNAEFIQKAIDSASEGGRVVVPEGLYLTSTIKLKSNITLWLCEGAVLKAMPDAKKYQNNGFFDSFGMETNSFMLTRGAENVTIDGFGMIDLSAPDFVDFEISGDDRATYKTDAADIPAKPGERIRRPILFDNCDNVKILNIKIINAPCWTLTFNNCRDVKVYAVTIENNIRAPHSDGIHLCGTSGAVISMCNIQSGDDCIALTSLLDDSKICRDITVSDCIFKSRSAAVRIGHMSGKIENVIISNIIIRESNRGIAIFAGNCGYVKNVLISRVIMDTHIYAGGWWGKGEPFVITSANSDGIIQNVDISDIMASSENIGVISGNVKNIRIRNFAFDLMYTDKRKYAGEFDIQPNGELKIKNTFEGKYFTDRPDEVFET